MDEDVPEEATGGSDGDPAASASLISVVEPLPGELGAGRAVLGAVSDIEPPLYGAEDEAAVIAAFEDDVGRLDQVEVIVVPHVHLDNAPAPLERPGQGGGSPHHAAPPTNFGSRTRL